MKHLPWRLFALGFTLTTLIGCASGGKFNAMNLTNVELSQNNFRVIATNIHGEASAVYLLGFSFAQSGEMQTIAFFPLSGERLLYKVALENLWRNFEQTYGNAEGRHLALVNVRFDADAQNLLFLYTKPKISIRADVIEFVEPRE